MHSENDKLCVRCGLRTVLDRINETEPPLAEIIELTSCFSFALNERSIVNDFPVNAPVLCVSGNRGQ